MIENEANIINTEGNEAKISIKSYVFGFAVSLILTFCAYFVVNLHILTKHNFPPDDIAIYLLSTLAIIQFLTQSVFFLHLGKESKPRVKLLIFLSTISIILLVVIGSIWIMNHLNYNMMPQDIYKYVIRQEGLH